MKLFHFLIVLSLLCTVIGCGPSGNLDGVKPSSGIVTLDGQPLDEAFVSFLPEKVEGYEPRSARAVSKADGTFQLMTLQANDGLYPGEYKVTVSKVLVEEYTEAQKKLLEEGKNVPPPKETELVPKIYTERSTTPLTVTIGPKGEKEIKIELSSQP